MRKNLLLSNPKIKKWLLIVSISILLGLFWTFIFYPGLPNADALYQWKQATDNFYTDIHPIGVTLIMRAVMVLFPSLLAHQQMAIICLLQASILWLTLFYCIEIFITNLKVKYIARFILPFYYPIWTLSISPIKDVWSAILLLLLICNIYQLLNLNHEQKENNPKKVLLTSLLSGGIIFFLSNIAMLTRHNISLSILLLMIYIYLLSRYLFKFSSRKIRTQYLILFLIVTSIFTSKIGGNFYYKNSHLSLQEKASFSTSVFDKNLSFQEKINFYFSLELIGTIYFTDQNIENLKFLESPHQLGQNKIAKAVENYRCGLNDQYLYLGEEAPLRNMQAQAMQAPIVSDLFRLSIKYPQAFLKYKLCSVSSILQVHQLLFPFQSHIPINGLSNRFQIQSKNYMPTIKGRIVKFLNLVSYDRKFFLLNLLYRHYILLFISMITSIYITIRNKFKSWKNTASLFLFGAGVCNFIPYIIVTPDFAWRYLLFSDIVWVLSTLTLWNPLVNNNKAIISSRT